VVILDTMTVREALLFAAELKLPKAMPHADKIKRAMDVADLLNLHGCLDNLVGSSLIKGISGGEKRRLSLGMEMITNPSILYLDEPTSGLDSYTAYKVARILRNVAHRYGRTVVCTIHQPSSEVYNVFDDLIVLAEGQVLYHGPVANMVPYFATLGYTCPNNFNPADFLFLDILNTGKA
jgi:ABC-type multidrug transport system ATPase subunit